MRQKRDGYSDFSSSYANRLGIFNGLQPNISYVSEKRAVSHIKFSFQEGRLAGKRGR
jgi:hypothetical protein